MVDTNSGYYEVHIPVWNPQEKDNPTNLTLDIYADSTELDDINPNLESTLQEYGESLSEVPDQEEFIQSNLQSLIDKGLLMDVVCDKFDIHSVEDLEEKLEEPTFELFPL